MFSRRPGPISEPCVLRLIMDSNLTGDPTRAGAATTLFSIFVTRRDFPTRSDLCETNLLQQAPANTAVCKNLWKSEQQTDLPGDKVQYEAHNSIAALRQRKPCQTPSHAPQSGTLFL